MGRERRRWGFTFSFSFPLDRDLWRAMESFEHSSSSSSLFLGVPFVRLAWIFLFLCISLSFLLDLREADVEEGMLARSGMV